MSSGRETLSRAPHTATMLGVGSTRSRPKAARAPAAGRTTTRRRALRLPPRRKLVAALAVWAVLVAAALGLATRLDQPVGSGALDPSQPIIAGPVVDPGFDSGQARELPPLALVLDRPFPAEIADLPLGEQIQRLTQSAQSERTAIAWVRVGVAQQGADDGPAAERSYRLALEIEPDFLPGRLGLVMVQAAQSPQDLVRARLALDALARRQPRSQLIAFNQGWLAVYSRDGGAAVDAWTRTAEIDPGSFLGDAATRLVDAIGTGGGP